MILEKQLEQLADTYHHDNKEELLSTIVRTIDSYHYNISQLQDNSFVEKKISNISKDSHTSSADLKNILSFYYLVLLAQMHSHIESDRIEVISPNRAAYYTLHLYKAFLMLNQEQSLTYVDSEEFSLWTLALDRNDIIRDCIKHGLWIPNNESISSQNSHENLTEEDKYLIGLLTSETKPILETKDKTGENSHATTNPIIPNAKIESSAIPAQKQEKPKTIPKLVLPPRKKTDEEEECDRLIIAIQQLKHDEFNKTVYNNPTLLNEHNVKSSLIGKLSEKTKKKEMLKTFLLSIDISLHYCLELIKSIQLSTDAKDFFPHKFLRYKPEVFFEIPPGSITFDIKKFDVKLKNDWNNKIKENHIWLEKQIIDYQNYVANNPDKLDMAKSKWPISDTIYFKDAIQNLNLLESPIWKKIINTEPDKHSSNEYQQLLHAFEAHVKTYKFKIPYELYKKSMLNIAATQNSHELLDIVINNFRDTFDEMIARDNHTVHQWEINYNQDTFEELFNFLTPKQLSVIHNSILNDSETIQLREASSSKGAKTSNITHSSTKYPNTSKLSNAATFLHYLMENKNLGESDFLEIFDNIFSKYGSDQIGPEKKTDKKYTKHLELVFLSKNSNGNSLYNLFEMRDWISMTEYSGIIITLLFQMMHKNEDNGINDCVKKLIEILDKTHTDDENTIIKKFINEDYDSVNKYMNIRHNLRHIAFNASSPQMNDSSLTHNILGKLEYETYKIENEYLFDHIFDKKNNEVAGIIELRNSDAAQLFLHITARLKCLAILNLAKTQKNSDKEVEEKIDDLALHIKKYNFNLEIPIFHDLCLSEYLGYLNNIKFTRMICNRLNDIKITTMTLFIACDTDPTDHSNFVYLLDKYILEQASNNKKEPEKFPAFNEITIKKPEYSLDLLEFAIFQGVNASLGKIEMLLKKAYLYKKSFVHSDKIIKTLLTNLNHNATMSYNYAYNVISLILAQPDFKGQLYLKPAEYEFKDGHYVFKDGHYEFNRLEINFIFEKWPRNENDEKILHKIIPLLLDNGNVITHQDIQKKNILHYAILKKASLSTIELLIKETRLRHSEEALAKMLTQEGEFEVKGIELKLTPLALLNTWNQGNSIEVQNAFAPYVAGIKEILNRESKKIPTPEKSRISPKRM